VELRSGVWVCGVRRCFDDFFSFILVFVLWQFGVFSVWLLSFFVNPKGFFFWGKTRDSENTVLNIFFRVRSGGDLIDHRSVSGGQRQKGAKMNAVILFFFSFFCRGRDIFAKIKHTKLTYYSTFISRIQHKISIFFPSFFVKLMWWTGLHLFFISRFFFWPFLTFFNWWQWLEGHSFGLVLGIFVLNYSDLFGFIRIYSVFSAGLAWWGIMAKTLPEISSNWAFTLSMTGSIWALFKI